MPKSSWMFMLSATFVATPLLAQVATEAAAPMIVTIHAENARTGLGPEKTVPDGPHRQANHDLPWESDLARKPASPSVPSVVVTDAPSAAALEKSASRIPTTLTQPEGLKPPEAMRTGHQRRLEKERSSHSDACACKTCDCCPCDCRPGCDPIGMHRTGAWAGFLYLHAGDVDMAHAIQQNGAGGAGTVPDGEVGTVAPEYEPAFAVGVNEALSDTSSVWVSYTHFESRAADAIAAPPGVGGTVNSLVLHPGTINAGSTSSLVNARYDIDFNMLDLNFSRLIGSSDRHAINYHAGVRYGMLKQEFGQRGVFAPPTGDLNTTSLVDFEGVGPRIGIDGRGRLGDGGLSIYGNSFLTFFVGEFDSIYQQDNLTTSTRQAFSDWDDNRMVPQLESELGIAWMNCSGCLRISVGYQLQWWFNAITVADHVRAVQTNNFSNVGDTITFDGLTSRVEWRF